MTGLIDIGISIFDEREKCYDTKGYLIRKGQVCICSPGSLVNEPYKVRVIEVANPDPDNGSILINKGKAVKGPYLCTELVDKSGHRSVLYPEWAKKRLTII